MRQATFLLRATTIVTAIAFAVGAAAAQAAGLGGSWTGEVTQNEPPQSFPMEMNLYGESGNISYPSLGCGGNLHFVRRDGESYWYREQLTYGQDKCIDGGMVVLRPHALGGSSNWEFGWHSGGVSVRGVVRGSGAPKAP